MSKWEEHQVWTPRSTSRACCRTTDCGTPPSVEYRFAALACLALLVGCDSKEDVAPAQDKPTDATPDKGEDEPKQAADDEPKGSDATKDQSAATNTKCPELLKGSQKGDLTITKACGAVPVSGSYRVDEGTLTLEAGTTLAFEDGAELSVGYYGSAKLIVQGTKDAPVTLTSKGDNAAGVWKGIRLHNKAARSTLHGLQLEYAGDDKFGGLYVNAPDVEVSASTVQHISGAGVVSGKDASFASFTDNTFTDVGKVAIRLPPNVVAGLGAGNTYSDAQRIVVTAGSISGDAQWLTQDAIIQVGGDVRVDGEDGTRAKLSLAPGARLEFASSARLIVGYYGDATFEARGTSEKPISFNSADRQEPGAWKGITVAGKGEGFVEHAQFRHGGKEEADGVLHAEASAHLSVKNVTFESNAHGVVLQGKDISLDAFEGNTFKTTPAAITLNAATVGSLGSGNTYADAAVVTIDAGTVDKDARWELQTGAKVLMDGRLQVTGARLTLPAGFQMAFKDGTEMVVGYYDPAALIVEGTAEAPVVLSGQRDEAGAWKGLSLAGKSAGSQIRHLTLENAADPAVKLNKSAAGTIEGLKCERCAGEAIAKPDGSTFEIK